jgi:pyridoxine 5-phosphate synthase
MVGIAIRTKPDAVSLVPENPNEITTEGGLDVIAHFENVKNAVEKLKAAGIFVSIFIDPDLEQISAAQSVGAQQVEALYSRVCRNDAQFAGHARRGRSKGRRRSFTHRLGRRTCQIARPAGRRGPRPHLPQRRRPRRDSPRSPNSTSVTTSFHGLFL